MSSKLDKINVKSPKSSPPKLPEPKLSEPKLQGRDTIYIDTEDDITSIIEKVKESRNSVIALVPPKRIGALQSVVNLKLLQKAAKMNRKKIALVTTEPSLMSLAGTLSIPVARSLNSQPILVEVPDADEYSDDFIDGNDVAVGDLAKMDSSKSQNHGANKEDEEITAAVAAIETDDRIKNDLDADGEPDDKSKISKKDKKRIIPNFDSFRKKLLLFGGLGVAAISFLVWAIWFAPNATIVVSAKTTAKDYQATISLSESDSTNVEKNVIQPVVKQVKKTETATFTATGTKEIGEKAQGKVTIYNKNDTSSKVTLAAGTTLISEDRQQFSLNSAVTVPGSTVSGGAIVPGSVTASVTATLIGTESNIAADSSLSVAGQGSKVYAVAKADFTGGSKETVTVVQQSDIDTITDKIKDQIDKTQLETDLTSQIGSDVTVIKDSFAVNYGDTVSKPAVGETATGGSASATMEITYVLIGITDSDLKSFADYQTKSLTDDGQKVYDNGSSKTQIKNFSITESGYSVIISSTAQIGPNLDEADIKKRALGKRSGEISASLESVSGISNVDVKFSPFWVGSVSDESKIKVEFAVDE